MWLWLWTTTITLWASNPSPTGDGVLPLAPQTSTNPAVPGSSSGPAPEKESTLLFSEAKTAFDEKKYNNAITLFERIISRYPSSPEFQNAHLYLGVSYLKNSQAPQAIPPLRHYIEAQGKKVEGTLARTFLTEALLEEKRFTQAQLVTQEILNRTQPKVTGTLGEARLQALLQRAHALLGLKKLTAASRVLQEAQSHTRILADTPHLRGYTYQLLLWHKVQNCTLLPSSKKLNEDQIIHQMTRRGLCIQEAIELLSNTLRTNEITPSHTALNIFEQECKSFVQTSQSPPLPNELRFQTQEQKDRYERELKDRLQLIVREHLQNSVAQLDQLFFSMNPEIKKPFEELKVNLKNLTSNP